MSLWRLIKENKSMSFDSKKSSKHKSKLGEYNFKSLSKDGYAMTQPSGFLNPSKIQIYVIAWLRCPPAESPTTISCLGLIPSYSKACVTIQQ